MVHYTLCMYEYLGGNKSVARDKGALPYALPNALPDALTSALPYALPDALHYALHDALPGALTGALPYALPNALSDALHDALTVALLDALPGALTGALLDALSVYSALPCSLPARLYKLSYWNKSFAYSILQNGLLVSLEVLLWFSMDEKEIRIKETQNPILEIKKMSWQNKSQALFFVSS